ncbi:uncharacterized protein isoform X2 [Rhodnius prolixus]|uniref:uncharacterized protein isoform X2 n=1 Tax=Rhodnius prolixus TaxID=13249 RepID=UPI003D18885D
MQGRDISPKNVPRNAPKITVRPRSQDAYYRSRSPIAQAFFNIPSEQSKEEEEQEVVEEIPEIKASEHQLACPWNKVKKLKSKENAKSPGKDELHPRPWGVRSPKEIPCTCKIPKNDLHKFSRLNPYSVLPSISLKSPAHCEVNKALDIACKEIDKIKIQLTTEEATEFANKVKMVLEKKVRPKGKLADRERGGNKSLKKAVSFSSHQPKSNTTSIVEAKDSAKDRQLQSMTPTTKQIGHSLPAGNIMIEPPGAMNMTPTAVVGTMESTNYFIELSTAHPVKQNANTEFKNIMTHVLPKVDKPKLVNVDGAYYAEVPNEFNVPQTNQVCPDSRLVGKRTENVMFYALADKQPPQNVIYAKPKSPYSNTKYIPVAKLPALGLPQQVGKQIVKK